MSMRLMLALVAGLVILSLGSDPSRVSASCEECSMEDDESACLLGCPESDPECIQMDECKSDPDGGCTGKGTPECTRFPMSFAPGQPLADKFARFTLADGSTVFRRACDAGIVSREYTEEMRARLTVEMQEIAL